MGLVTQTVPQTVYCATDGSKPRWRTIIRTANRGRHVLTIDRLQSRARGASGVRQTTISGEALKQRVIYGRLTLRPKQAVGIEVVDDGHVDSPVSVTVDIHFSRRTGLTDVVRTLVDLQRRKTTWLEFPLLGRWILSSDRSDYHCVGTQFGFDFARPEDLKVFGNRTRTRAPLQEYSSVGRPVHSPTAGTVVACVSSRRDYAVVHGTKPTMGYGALPLGKSAGNHVLVKTKREQFVLLAHMQQGSIQVRKGDVVSSGDPLGSVGNSGNTIGPHLHIEVMDAMPDFSRVHQCFSEFPSGLPFGFRDVMRTRGKSTQKMARCVPRTQDILESRKE